MFFWMTVLPSKSPNRGTVALYQAMVDDRRRRLATVADLWRGNRFTPLKSHLIPSDSLDYGVRSSHAKVVPFRLPLLIGWF